MSTEAMIGLGIQVLVGLITVIAAYYALKHAVADSRKEAAAAKKAAEKAAADQERDHRAVLRRLDELEQALRKRLEDQDRRITIVETTQGHHARQLDRGFEEIKGLISALGDRFSADIKTVHSRIDEAFRAEPKR